MTTISDPTLLGLPSEAELANLAQGYLSDIDPNICLNGIANLADGDSALLESRFETKAGQVNADLNNYFGADQKIIDDVLSLDPFNVTNQQPSGSKGQNAVSYSPKILSEKESKQREYPGGDTPLLGLERLQVFCSRTGFLSGNERLRRRCAHSSSLSSSSSQAVRTRASRKR